tara:strand:- start:797 stop:2179 length:1383 start_codon:yes stop_codon:yes gene_type:complete
MGFKMKGFPRHKGAKGLPNKTHLKKDEYIPQSVVNRGKELDVDPNDPDYFNMMHTDKDYISMDMRAEEEGKRGPGEDIERSSGYGSSRNTNEKHEGYRGVKDEGAGYSDFTLGARNEQEKQDNQRFNKDLNKNLKNYKSKLPISGDWKMDDETFDYWKNITKASGSDSDLRKRFEGDVTDSLNLDNELKLATEAGYKPNSVALRDADPSINLEEGDYKLNEGKYKAHQENKDLRQVAVANRKADDAMNKANEHVDKYGGTVADFFGSRPNLRDDVQGIHSFGQVDVATQGSYDDAIYADMSKKEKKQYDKKKEEERQKELQIKSEIEANLPVDPNENSDDAFVSDDTDKKVEMVDKNKDGISDYAQSPDYVDPAEEVQEVTVKENEKKFDERDTNQDGVVDRYEKKAAKRAAMFADEQDPQSSMTKKPVFGTDEYYDFMKKKRTEEMGLTKRMFNIYDKD